ncbi:homoserine kinase [bacterium BMS3Abin02]|nr:homoserine kinase [bacterium BMS3Abin02]GBE22060.1 homoserine kinase [bacterium BMS3Bbin01]HDH26835.1 homoserine kinase [Actinomycetota bacterium]
MSRATAPGSSGNLGPGFDTLALALELRCRVDAMRTDVWKIRQVGAHRPEHGDAVLAAARLAVGDRSPLVLTVQNEIPIGRGLGSSAAVAAAGAAAAWRAVGHTPLPSEVFGVATEIDGHPDNAAASVYGGLVSVTTEGTVLRLALHESIELVIGVPRETLSTREARKALPDSIDRNLGVRSLQRIVALVEGLRTGDAEALSAAAGDEFHESPRARLNPRAKRLIDAARRAGALHACWSGAGPSVLALTAADRRTAVVDAMRAELGNDGVVLTPEVAVDGVKGTG